MKKYIAFSLIALVAIPAYADLTWSASTTWADDAINSALTSVGADDATTTNFNTRYAAAPSKNVNGAYMGALYAASLNGDVAPVAAVDAGYDFMQKLLSAQENANNKPVASDDVDDVQSDAEIPADEPVVSDDVDDVQSDTEVPADEPVTVDNTPLTDADIASVKTQLAYLLDSRCANMNVIKNSTDMSGGSVPANLNCTRVAPDKNVFRCEYSRTYTLQGKQYVCKTASAFNVNFGKGGHFTGDADKAYLEVVAADNSQNSKINTEQNASTKTIITDINRAQEIVGPYGEMTCAMALRKWGNYKVNKSYVKCEPREDNSFLCQCEFTITFEDDVAKSCSTRYYGQVYAEPEKPLGGDFYNTTTYNIVEKTKREQRADARAAKKELREIEKREKAGTTDDDKKPSYVAPLTDGTDADLKPDYDAFIDELSDGYVRTPTKQEQRDAAREQRQTTKAVKKALKKNKK